MCAFTKIQSEYCGKCWLSLVRATVKTTMIVNVMIDTDVIKSHKYVFLNYRSPLGKFMNNLYQD